MSNYQGTFSFIDQQGVDGNVQPGGYIAQLLNNGGGVMASQNLPADADHVVFEVPNGTGYTIRAARVDILGQQIQGFVTSSTFDVATPVPTQTVRMVAVVGVSAL